MHLISLKSYHLILIEKLFETKKCFALWEKYFVVILIDIVHYIDIDSLSLSLRGRTKINSQFNQLNPIGNAFFNSVNLSD